METSKYPDNEAKRALWAAYARRLHTRVPLTWNANPRIVLLNPQLNPAGYDFRQYFDDPRCTLLVQARFQEYVATQINRFCDLPVGLPDSWIFYIDSQNVFDPAYFGANVEFPDHGQPAVNPMYSLEDVGAFLRQDFSDPISNPWLADRIRFHARLVHEAERFSYLGRKGSVRALQPGFDGPLTVLVSLFGEDALILLSAEPDTASRLLLKITRDCIRREQELGCLAGGWRAPETVWFADDAIQMIGSQMLRDIVLPAHAEWYDTMGTARSTDRKRFIHLCGDATRHFRLLRDLLGIYTFETGFPVDHGALRRELGPEVEIQGGPPAGLLVGANPSTCARAALDILCSGVTAGGRFILRDGNDLPPGTPLDNLKAVYEVCLEQGQF